MRFSEFMREWLYAPDDGYYASYKEIGKSGDFYTAVSASKLFGGSIANYIFKLIQEKRVAKDATIVEIGAHRGYLLADIVQFLYTFDPSLIHTLTFAIIEPMERLRAEQKRYFQECYGDAVTLHHFVNLEEVQAEDAFIVANEIFDAFPCELWHKGKMAYVNDFCIDFQEPDAWVVKKALQFGIERGEVAIGYEEFAKRLFSGLKKAHFVTFDYGDLQPRNDFSIRIYTKHKVYPLFDKELDIKAAYKKSDITYDVNFTHLIEAFEQAGWKKRSYKTQLVALVDFGITELLETIQQRVGFEAYKREADKAKILLHPSIMGERFKMVEFVKGQD